MNTPFEKRNILYKKQFSIGIIITAHQDFTMIPPLIDSLLKQSFKNYNAYIVADDIKDTSHKYQDPRIIILKPLESLNSKIHSISYAIKQFKIKHDIIIIFDADNLLEPSYLEKVNLYFQKGYRVVQTNFKPKNIDTIYARMDAIGDMFNFFIERQVRYYFNLSSTIWGSGVAIDAKLYQKPDYKDNLGGFDRKLQAYLVTNVDRIAFAEDAILYDEKISSGKSLENQRTRWINSYFKYFKESFAIFSKGIKQMDLNLIYFGFNVIRPPLFIVFSSFIFISCLLYFISPIFAVLGTIVLMTFILSFTCIIVIKGGFRYVKTLIYLPIFLLRQFVALTRISEAKKSFIKTEHDRVVYIDEILKPGKK